MEDEMIKRFIDNLKPPYYEKMISAQVTHFTTLIPIRECIYEGIRSKKIVDLEALNSMKELQVKKATSHKRKKANAHMIEKIPEGLMGVTSTCTTSNA